MKAILALEDGTIFEGETLGAVGKTHGEVVFNTGMTGYQEILTDPSYAGQIVTLTYPLIGNYGINEADFESRKVQVEGFIVREAAEIPSNWRSQKSLGKFLEERNIVAIQGIDTRALTKILRQRGVMMGAISTELTSTELLATLHDGSHYSDSDYVRSVTTPTAYKWLPDGTAPVSLDTPTPENASLRVSLLDCGVKYNILRSLANLGCEVTVYPCDTNAKDLLLTDPDGIMLSPGPGDPENYGYLVETVRELSESGKPVLGVCLGNQLLGCAFGSKTYKLKFGHRGSNHPVKDLSTGRVSITSQNHGYAIDGDLLKDGMEVAHVNLNDGTVEGLRHRELPIFSIQYHPEASPGPMDSAYFFGEFIELMEARK
ncbi:MAG: glutamine-hydrolyzing carbamoyl-phosphate synthase small subunit [Chthonomonadaceae bacterium]|nr:glutamine-hydrolyzing carbamoyl-phosphate synthase small subunit [Chthonomonadaceae bacterium]